MPETERTVKEHEVARMMKEIRASQRYGSSVVAWLVFFWACCCAVFTSLGWIGLSMGYGLNWGGAFIEWAHFFPIAAWISLPISFALAIVSLDKPVRLVHLWVAGGLATFWPVAMSVLFAMRGMFL